MKQYNIIWLSAFLLFLFETTLLHWFIPINWHEHIHISPHFVFIIILFVAIHSHRHLALGLGLVFGLLQDLLFYGFMIGPFGFAMGLLGYLTGLIFRRSNISFLFTMFVIVVANLLFDFIIYGLYRLFKVMDVTLGWAFMYSILPSLLFNLLFAIVIYIPVRFLLEHMEEIREEEES